MNPRQMNPRQRQGLLLVVVAGLGLIGVFLLIANYVSTVSKQVGPKVGVLALTASVSPYQAVSAGELGEVSVPAKWAPRNALQDPSQAIGLISSVALPAGTELEQGMLTSAPALQPGQREIAILVDAETGVAGQITPGSVVDIVATFEGAGQGAISSARVVVAGAKVLGVGTPTAGGATGGGGGSTGGGATASDAVVPVTFALSPQQVLKVSYAESFAQKVRLSLVAPGTSGPPANLPPYAPGP